MATGGEPGHLHPVRTRTHDYQYFFYDKHHGRGGREVAQWPEDVSEPEEFGIFDRADEFDLSDDGGSLYGIRIGPDRVILVLGSLRQQVAKFPHAHPGQPWHGFPLGPLNKTKQSHPPIRPVPRVVLRKMVTNNLLGAVQRKLLERGYY